METFYPRAALESNPKKGLICAFDIESTVNKLEGLPWLAEKKGTEVMQKITNATNQAMGGKVSFQESLLNRLRVLQPTGNDIEVLSREYLKQMVAEAKATMDFAKEHFTRVVLISGGIREALIPLAQALGINPQKDLYAISLTDIVALEPGLLIRESLGNLLETEGDRNNPIFGDYGKKMVMEKLIEEETEKYKDDSTIDPTVNVMVGDGMTDARTRSEKVKFIAFTGVEERQKVVEVADFIAKDLRTVQEQIARMLKQF